MTGRQRKFLGYGRSRHASTVNNRFVVTKYETFGSDWKSKIQQGVPATNDLVYSNSSCHKFRSKSCSFCSFSFGVPMSRSGIHKVQACCNCPASDLLMMYICIYKCLHVWWLSHVSLTVQRYHGELLPWLLNTQSSANHTPCEADLCNLAHES